VKIDCVLMTALLALVWGCGTNETPGTVEVLVREAPLPREDLKRMEKRTGEGLQAEYQGDYRFSTDWFGRAVDLWKATLGPLAGKPNLRYLEIGVYEGRSAFWAAEHILTHPSSQLVVIDPFFGDTEATFRKNLAKFAYPEKFEVIKGYSQQELPRLEPKSFDIVYIDGSHSADDVLADAVMSFELLKVGGVMIFDDYAWNPHLPPELRPMTAIDAFVTNYRYRVDVAHRSNQLVLQKLAGPPCEDKRYCSQIGDHLYFWDSRSMFRIEPYGKVEATPEEVKLVENFLRLRRQGADGDTWFSQDIAQLRIKPGFDPLMKRLGADPLLPSD